MIRQMNNELIENTTMKDPRYIAGEEVFGKVKPYRYNPPTLSESFEGQRMNLVLLAAWCALMVAFAFAAVRRLRAQYGKKIMLKIIFSHEVRQIGRASCRERVCRSV